MLSHFSKKEALGTILNFKKPRNKYLPRVEYSLLAAGYACMRFKMFIMTILVMTALDLVNTT